MSTVALINYEIPDDVHRRAKIAAINKGQTLKAFLIEALEQAARAAEKDTRRPKSR